MVKLVEMKAWLTSYQLIAAAKLVVTALVNQAQHETVISSPGTTGTRLLMMPQLLAAPVGTRRPANLPLCFWVLDCVKEDRPDAVQPVMPLSKPEFVRFSL